MRPKGKAPGTYGIIMSVEVCLALELLRARVVAHHGGTRVRVLAFRVVRLHVGLPIVAALEELSAHSAFVGRFFGGGPLTLLLDPGDAGKDGLDAEARQLAVGTGVQFGEVARRVVLGPFRRLSAVDIFGLGPERVGTGRVGEGALG